MTEWSLEGQLLKIIQIIFLSSASNFQYYAFRFGLFKLIPSPFNNQGVFVFCLWERKWGHGLFAQWWQQRVKFLGATWDLHVVMTSDSVIHKVAVKYNKNLICIYRKTIKHNLEMTLDSKRQQISKTNRNIFSNSQQYSESKIWKSLGLLQTNALSKQHNKTIPMNFSLSPENKMHEVKKRSICSYVHDVF